MATRFVSQAQQQLNPAYNQQVGALQSQIPALQQLYEALVSSLRGETQQAQLGALENTASRGVLRSSMSDYDVTQAAQQGIAKQGQYAANLQTQLGDIYGQIGQVETQRAGAISGLANQLYGANIQQQTLNNQIAQGNRQYALDQQTANKQYQLGLQAARRGY